MSFQSGHRGVFVARVVRNHAPCSEHFEIECEVPDFPDAAPGQFVQILCRPPWNSNGSSVAAFASASPMLRRPFSIARIRRGSDCVALNFMGRVVGRGTAWLNELRPGDCIDILGPLGGAFTPPPADARVFLVAGGVGLPPIRWLAESLRDSRADRVFIFGAQRRELVPLRLSADPSKEGIPSMCAEELTPFGCPAVITTDDGSCGMRGRVTDALRAALGRESRDQPTQVYGCGPERMLHALASLCEERGIACELALERVMGCGMGTCQSCVVHVVDETKASGWRFALCCTEGPVFDARRVKWD